MYKVPAYVYGAKKNTTWKEHHREKGEIVSVMSQRISEWLSLMSRWRGNRRQAQGGGSPRRGKQGRGRDAGL